MADKAKASGEADAVRRAVSAGRKLARLAEQNAATKLERQHAVVQLRDEHGWSHHQVAEALGVTRTTAQSIYEGRSSSGTRHRPAREDSANE